MELVESRKRASKLPSASQVPEPPMAPQEPLAAWLPWPAGILAGPDVSGSAEVSRGRHWGRFVVSQFPVPVLFPEL